MPRPRFEPSAAKWEETARIPGTKGLHNLDHWDPTESSDAGQKRIVAARAFVIDLHVLLLDELLSNLDINPRGEIPRLRDTLRFASAQVMVD